LLFVSTLLLFRWNSFVSTKNATRFERGFLGVHSDIGGSYRGGDLAKVELARWTKRIWPV
jgi:hypothetical protein